MNETIEEKAQRLLKLATTELIDDLPSYVEKMIELAIAEEREACAKIADVTSWGGDAADLIRARSAAPKDEVSE